jgi:hypothetical protein
MHQDDNFFDNNGNHEDGKKSVNPRITAAAERIETTLSIIASRAVWDIILYMMGVDLETKRRIIISISKVVIDCTREELSSYADVISADKFIESSENLDEAIQIAYGRFSECYESPILTEEFMSGATDLISQTIKKFQEEDRE